ncbi:PQQ-like beta-propeller repeat protein [bacterium]|nr:PQQ-like beta-propeller repeat protein [bacterium]
MGLKSLFVLFVLTTSFAFPTDWRTLRGSVDRNGYIPERIVPPFRLLWARHFANERMGTSVEPIVAEGKLFITTHNGNLYALDAQTGNPIWRFKANNSFLHSPAFSDGLVVAGNADGYLYAVDARNGKLLWRVYGGRGGFSASPTIAERIVFIGSREGRVQAVDLFSGKLIWEKKIGVPIRQTASYFEGKIILTGEDMRVRCFDAKSGKLLWISNPLMGQTARDYYPIIVKSGDKRFVLIRTNPVLNMAQLLAQDRGIICRSAGIDDSDWRNIDAWTKSNRAKGNPQLWKKESQAILGYLKEHPEARTFFLLDLDTGKEVQIAPILWTGGCQGVGNLPVVLPDGRLLLMYRTAYGNWNLGVAPLVSLGIYEISRNFITPLFHSQGSQPPWNTFWGTADESQNFLLVGNTLLIIHQGTLSGFDLNSQQLFPIWGERDSWGGFRNLPWARNEWHGPARGSAAIVGNRIYLQVGSRLLCLTMGENVEKPLEEEEVDGSKVATNFAPKPAKLQPSALKRELASEVEKFLSTSWMPLYVEPGLGGKEFFFSQSGDIFEALSYAYPHLPPKLRTKVKDFLAREWEKHPPYSSTCQHDLRKGKAREWAYIPSQLRELREEEPLPFGNIYSIWLYAERCGEWEKVKNRWEEIKRCFDDFLKRKWRLEEKGDLRANRYLASLIAFQKMAERMGDIESQMKVKPILDETSSTLLIWWKSAANTLSLPIFRNIQEWDDFIGKGDALFYCIRPHKAKIALFHDLTPEVAAILRDKAQGAIQSIWQSFELLCPTWHLVGEERQVHFGENFLDPPDFAYDAFRANAWLNDEPFEELVDKIDIPFCQADLYYIAKLSIALDKTKKRGFNIQD